MTIYDFGANVGQNLVYFLSKADMVVAVEANPQLCDEISAKFTKEISSGKLVVINCCLSETEDDVIVDFYINTVYSVLSQFNKPDDNKAADFKKIQVSTRRPSTIVNQFGAPYYIKIDIEHYDINVLRNLTMAKIYPEYISVEAHNPEVLQMLLGCGKYKRFNVVHGESLHKMYNNFDLHWSGPFGTEIKSPWLDEKGIKKLFENISFGWIDIHASTNENLPVGDINLKFYLDFPHRVKNMIRQNVPPQLYKFLNKINRMRLGMKDPA